MDCERVTDRPEADSVAPGSVNRLPAFSAGVDLYEWQREALSRWEQLGYRGTMKVVTGAGKTVLGLAAIDRLSECDPDLRVAIIVPTVVLQRQWLAELTNHGGDAVHGLVGLMGGDRTDHFSLSHRVVIAVLNSASKYLAADVEAAAIGDHLLLVVDEVHRSGASVMSRIFRTRRAYTLGLSATPERDESDDGASDGLHQYDESLLGREVGPIVFELSLAEAIDQGVLPPFSINHYGVALVGPERSKYESLSQSIKAARERLEGLLASRGRPTAGLIPFAQSLAGSEGPHASAARRFIAETQERKRLLYRATARASAVGRLLRQEFRANPGARALLFHESIEEVEVLATLLEASFPGLVAVEHSKLSDKRRADTIERFRIGKVQILVSVKSLIEGFNVPAADVGVIVASSSSVRQRVQTLGRLLRRHRVNGAEEKHSVMHVLYVRDTVDDAIYAQEDWEAITGRERNAFFLFLPPEDPQPQDGPPRRPLPRDREIDVAELVSGNVYAGRYEGTEFSIDTQGNVKTMDGTLVEAPAGLWDAVHSVKGQAGRFRVTPNQRFVLARRLDNDGFSTRFVMQLAMPLTARGADQSPTGYVGPTDAVGEEYIVRRSGTGLRIGRPLGGGRRGIRFLQPTPALQEVIAAITQLEAGGTRLGRFRVNERGHAIAVVRGRWELLTERGSDLGV